jgi:hypothetical protein
MPVIKYEHYPIPERYQRGIEEGLRHGRALKADMDSFTAFVVLFAAVYVAVVIFLVVQISKG